MLSTTKSLLSMCAADIMTTSVVMIPREMSLPGAARMLARAQVTGAPIVDDRGRCIGVLSATDFMHWVEKENDHAGPHHMTPARNMCQAWEIPECTEETCGCVEEYMTRDPVLVPPGTRLGELARIMMDAHIHRVIVVDPGTHRPLGIVSSMDILAVLARVDQMFVAVEENLATEIPVGATR